MPKKKVQKKKQKGSKKRKGGKMPPKVVAYFKLRSAGMSKTAAKKKAGL